MGSVSVLVEIEAFRIFNIRVLCVRSMESAGLISEKWHKNERTDQRHLKHIDLPFFSRRVTYSALQSM